MRLCACSPESLDDRCDPYCTSFRDEQWKERAKHGFFLVDDEVGFSIGHRLELLLFEQNTQCSKKHYYSAAALLFLKNEADYLNLNRRIKHLYNQQPQ